MSEVAESMLSLYRLITYFLTSTVKYMVSWYRLSRHQMYGIQWW